MTYAKLAGLEERFADVRGVPMRYFVGGDGPPLILVHGLGGAAANWTELAPLLTRSRRLLVPDLPGHGGSGALPAVSGLEPFADRVAAVAERERMLPAPVVGHSLGGMVVLRLALRRPDAVQALVLAAGAGLSTGSAWGRELLSIFTVVRPGRIVARHRALVSRSALLRRLVFGFVSVADPIGLTDEADFFRVAAWDQQAQLCADYLAKGRKIGIEGRLRYRTWEDGDEKRSTVEVVAHRIEFLGGPRSAESEGGEVVPFEAAVA